jgi:NCAIR mutase (PurE)-related protein
MNEPSYAAVESAPDFRTRLNVLMQAVASGSVSPEEAAEALRHLPFADLGFARVDHHRALRQGLPEIVYAPGKSADHLTAIVQCLLRENMGPLLVTRAVPSQQRIVRRLASRFGLADEVAVASETIAVTRGVPSSRGQVLIVTGGTADLPVADEAAMTATLVGTSVTVRADVGVAGLHRLAALQDEIQAADVVIAVAGMEGALPSVVGGLTDRLVIACPTSVGYGANFGGLAALLACLSSCTPGVVCVNIDDGVGAGYSAAVIARASSQRAAAG